MTSKLIQTKELLEQNGYKSEFTPIGLHTRLHLWCMVCRIYTWHNLMVKDMNNYRYVCNKCDSCVEYVG